MIQDLYVFPSFNTVTPSSAGAAGATTFAKPPTGNAVNVPFPADTTVEILNDVEWIMAMG